MRVAQTLIVTTALTGATVLAAVLSVRAGGDKIVFPAEYGKGVLYATIDLADTKRVGDFYTSRAAVDAAKKDTPLPDGTVITSVQFAAQLDAQGNPAKDSNGRFIKTSNIVGYAVMEKRSGWGAEYPETKRNGEWEYQLFQADRMPNTKVNLDICFNCHKPQANNDFVFTHDKMKAASQ
jgi:hypothetical protein